MLTMNAKTHTTINFDKITSQPAPSWRTFAYWRELAIYFWVFSILGSYLEVLALLLSLSGTWRPVMVSYLPVAAPYGLGIAAIIAIILPIVKRYKPHVITTFVLCTLVSSAVEYASASFVVFFNNGHNQYWDYSGQPFNLNGFIALKSSVIFGILLVLFIYFLYPICEKYIRRIDAKWLNLVFWVMLVAYAADLFLFYILK